MKSATVNTLAKVVAFAGVLFLFSPACDRSDADGDDTTSEDASAAEAAPNPWAGVADREPSIPRGGSEKFSPSMASIAQGEHYDIDLHLETEKCAECHAEVVEQWSDSVHALSSMNNPYYRAAFEEFADTAGRDKAAFCGGCHDSTLVFDGGIQLPIRPEQKRSHAGITCNTCHGIKEVTTEGNASYVLSTTPIPIPKDGDAESLKKHLERVGMPPLRTSEMCSSCHIVFLSPTTGHDAIVGGVNEFTPWRRSVYNQNPATRIDDEHDATSCVDCHMPEVGPDRISSHRFAGGHSTMAAAIGSDEQLAAVEKMVESAAEIDIGAFGLGEVNLRGPRPERLEAGQTLWVDAIVYNGTTGHRFPSGALDLRDTWIELEVFDADGKSVAGAGTDYQKTAEDPGAHVLRALVSSTEGEVVRSHRVDDFRTAMANRSIAPRDAAVARFRWDVPEDAELKQPLEIVARLRHRRLHRSMYEDGCELSKTDEGKKFIEQTKRHTGTEVDPCVEQPVIEIGEARVKLGGAQTPEKPEWLRHYHRGLGLQHHVAESLGEAREALEAAMEKLPDDAPETDVARIEFQLGLIAARQNRTQDAMDHFARTERIVGEHPAIHRARGDAHRRTFQNEEATDWYLKAARIADDDRIWRSLAISAGSADRPKVSYWAALNGLEHEPRDPHLLRSQMLSLKKLGAPKARLEAAKQAFSSYKRDEEAAAVRDRCEGDDVDCQRERVPIVERKLR